MKLSKAQRRALHMIDIGVWYYWYQLHLSTARTLLNRGLIKTTIPGLPVDDNDRIVRLTPAGRAALEADDD